MHYRRCLQTRQQAESLQAGKECEYEELRFRRGSPLAHGVMGIASSSYPIKLYTDLLDIFIHACLSCCCCCCCFVVCLFIVVVVVV